MHESGMEGRFWAVKSVTFNHSLLRKKSLQNMAEITVQGQAIPKARNVRLRRKIDSAFFSISAPCLLRLEKGLLHIVGAPNEELDPVPWDVSEKFQVLKIFR
jgi:hypothetical protein